MLDQIRTALQVRLGVDTLHGTSPAAGYRTGGFPYVTLKVSPIIWAATGTTFEEPALAVADAVWLVAYTLGWTTVWERCKSMQESVLEECGFFYEYRR